MSTKHIVHERLIPGQAGDGFTPPEAAMVRDAVERVAPTGPATHIGASLQEGPDGPTWGRDAISADWYSDPNDAIAKAAESGNGGIVRFSRDTQYQVDEPLRVSQGVTLEGEDPFTTHLLVHAPTGIGVADPSVTNRWVQIRNLTLLPRGTDFDIGLDARGMTRFRFENIVLDRFWTNVVFGGDYPDYVTGWTGAADQLEMVVREGGTGVHFVGETPSGAVTPNNIAFRDSVITLHPSNGTTGIYMEGGDTNLIEHCDIGYGQGLAIPIRLGPKARANTFHANRTEGVDRSVLVQGGTNNVFSSNLFGGSHQTYSPVIIEASGGYSGRHNMFVGNVYSTAARDPVIDDSGVSGAPSTIIMDRQATHYQPRTTVHDAEQEFWGETAGDTVITTGQRGVQGKRFGITSRGQLQWTDAGGNIGASLGGHAATAGVIEMSAGSYLKVSHHTSMPTAATHLIGTMIEYNGNLYFCKGSPLGWVQVT